MKILVTHSYFLKLDAKQWRQQQPYPPLATLYAASVLIEAGHQVFFADSMFEQNGSFLQAHLNLLNPDVVVIYDDGFNYLTKMCLTNMRHECHTMIKMAKAACATAVVSSSDATDHSLLYLTEGADAIIVGEGEQTLVELIRALEIRSGLNDINGLRILVNNGLHQTKPREVLRNLDTIPWPAWQLLNIDPYRRAWLQHRNFFSLNITTTRGCPFKCNWCAKPIYGNRYNSRSPADVVNEIDYLQRLFNFQHIWFCDDIFGLKPQWIKLFAEAIKEKGARFKYKIQCRADLLLEENNIQWLAQSGCDEVWMGAESGSQKILDAMDKGITIAQIETATTLLKKHGIKPCFFLQFGYPSETMDDIALTLGMVQKLQPFDIGVSVSYPLPGTIFYENVKSQMGTKANWTDSDELAVMFENTFHTQFYKDLHRYLHRSFRASQAIRSLKNSSHDINHKLKKICSIPYHVALKLYHKNQLRKYKYDNVEQLF